MPDTPTVSAFTDAVRDRFDRGVDRSGEHHLWLGAKNPTRGTGRIKVGGKQATAHRIAWEIVNGALPETAKVNTCPDEPACVRIDHLSVQGIVLPSNKRSRSTRGTGSKREVRPGVWELTVTAGVHNDGIPRREYKTIDASNSDEAAAELARFVVEVRDAPIAPARDLKQMKVDEAVKLFLDTHLANEKGREDVTVKGYRQLHDLWFSPHIGKKLVRHVEPSMIDNVFGRMRRSGLSRSRMNQAKSLYSQFFRWARSRRMTSTNPMIEFQLPTSKQVSQERTPPELRNCLFF